jgi:soluble lytic murein transglycosylase-like protein
VVAPLIEEASAAHGVDGNLLKAIIATESGGNTQARSSKNAKGLMQLIDSTATVPDSLRRRLDGVAPLIQEASATHGVDGNLLKAIIATESGGNAQARSSKNAKGLMQLIDSTATAMGVRNVWDPRENVLGGAKYLSKLMDQFGGDRAKAVASYNAGPGAVLKHGGIPPFKETQAYVEKVMNYMRFFEQEDSGHGDQD